MTPQELSYYRNLAKFGSGASSLGGFTGASQGLGGAATGIGAYQGLTSGTTAGELGGAANLAKLGTMGWGGAPSVGGAPGTAPTSALSAAGFDPSTVKGVNMGATGALDALAMYQGIKQGGWQGYGQAAGAGLQGAGLLLNNPALSSVGGYVLAPLAVYNAVKNWQSGNTGSDALQGAEAGAAVGSIIPGVGTVIGAVVGGAIGAASSAFGGGRPDAETGNWHSYISQYNKADPATQAAIQQSMSPSQNFQNLAGVMDAKNNTPGHSESIEQVFGRMGEGNLTSQMANEINSAIKSGQINPNESIQDQYNKVIAPWLASKGATISPTAVASSGQNEGNALVGTLQGLMGQYESGQLTANTPVGISGQKIGNLANFAGWGSSAAAQPAATNAATAAFWGNNPQAASRMAPASTLQANNANFAPAAAPAAKPVQPMMPQASPYGWGGARGGRVYHKYLAIA